MVKNFESRKTKRECKKGFMNKNGYENSPHATMVFFETNDFILFHFSPSSPPFGERHESWSMSESARSDANTDIDPDTKPDVNESCRKMKTIS